jgi:hypothetical protein
MVERNLFRAVLDHAQALQYKFFGRFGPLILTQIVQA